MRGTHNWDTSQQAIFNRYAAGQEGENTEKGTPFLCLLRNFICRKDKKRMERKRKIKDGHIAVENPLYQELPQHEVT